MFARACNRRPCRVATLPRRVTVSQPPTSTAAVAFRVCLWFQPPWASGCLAVNVPVGLVSGSLPYVIIITWQPAGCQYIRARLNKSLTRTVRDRAGNAAPRWDFRGVPLHRSKALHGMQHNRFECPALHDATGTERRKREARRDGTSRRCIHATRPWNPRWLRWLRSVPSLLEMERCNHATLQLERYNQRGISDANSACVPEAEKPFC